MPVRFSVRRSARYLRRRQSDVDTDVAQHPGMTSRDRRPLLTATIWCGDATLRSGEFLGLITEHRVNYLATVPTIMHRAPQARTATIPRPTTCPRCGCCRRAPARSAVKEAGSTSSGRTRSASSTAAPNYRRSPRSPAPMAEPSRVGRPGSSLVDEGARRRRQRAPPGVVGEVYMRPGPGSAPDLPLHRGERQDRDGWDSLGDLGWFDADGYLYPADRRRHVHRRRQEHPPRRDRGQPVPIRCCPARSSAARRARFRMP